MPLGKALDKRMRPCERLQQPKRRPVDGIQSAKWEMVEAGGRTAQSFGLNRLLGQIYALLFLSEEPQSLDALCEQLGVSKASVSIACRQLEAWGALRRVWKKGDRRDYYVAEGDVWRVVNNGLLAAVQKKLDSAQIQIERSLRLLEEGEGDPQKKAFVRQRLQQAEAYRSRIAKLVNHPLLRKIF